MRNKGTRLRIRSSEKELSSIINGLRKSQEREGVVEWKIFLFLVSQMFQRVKIKSVLKGILREDSSLLEEFSESQVDRLWKERKFWGVMCLYEN